MSTDSYHLFARPTFLTGAAQIIDFGNTLFVYNESPNGEVADYFGIKSDWVVVGGDLFDAIYEAKDSLVPDGELQPTHR